MCADLLHVSCAGLRPDGQQLPGIRSFGQELLERQMEAMRP